MASTGVDQVDPRPHRRRARRLVSAHHRAARRRPGRRTVALHALISSWPSATGSTPRRRPRRSCTPRSTTAPLRCTTRWPTSATATSARSGRSSCASRRHRPPTRPPSPGSSSRSAGEVDVDRDALAEVTRRDTGETGPFPRPRSGPRTAAGAAALLASASAAEAVARLRTVARWVRTGPDRRRPAPARRRPCAGRHPGRRRHFRDHARTADDLPETSLLVAWARQARLLRGIKGRLVPVKSAAALLGRPIELWQRAFVAIGDPRRALRRQQRVGPRRCSGCRWARLPILLLTCTGQVAIRYSSLPYVASAKRSTAVPLHRRRPRGDVEQRLWRRDVTAVLDTLELLGRCA